MKKQAILTTLILTTTTLFSQNLQFTAPDPQPDIIEMHGGSSSSGDIDGDGDIDLIVTGITPNRRIDLSGLPSGVYYISVVIDDQVMTEKIVKQ